MDKDTKIWMVGIAIVIITILAWMAAKEKNSFGGMPEMGISGSVGTNMEFIGQLLRTGEMYCWDNIGIDLIYNNGSKKWVSMKQFCEMV